ncbi:MULTISPECIES: cupin domain-containing protein [Novosphingobium]|uniref:Cupin type-2 domain-containing protein n=1 Tax=Novosphingobium lindaniclasticum LE124 TaxID=1096930 RepID=T0IZF4_9SPHN|nr:MULTISPECIES: cupin domain-containing protein [Novosphingobium]EQB15079.1 hypothetical protein L284_12500 [Novosphingobium lindaniclasticum LE124]
MRTAGCTTIPTPVHGAPTSGGGDHLEAALRRFVNGETLSPHDDHAFEEVAAVLEGEFHVEAAGEVYDLSTGEGIVIPPGEPREWRCDGENGGLLYRVLVRVPGAPA